MPGSYNPLDIEDSYHLNAQCQLAYAESYEEAVNKGYSEPYLRTEVLGNMRFYCDLPVNRAIIAVRDITSACPIDLDVANVDIAIPTN